MIFSKILVKINVRGGILPSGQLTQIIDIAKACLVDKVHLGQRQNMYFNIDKSYKLTAEHLLAQSTLDYEIKANQYPNIVSSYAAEDLFTTHPWFSEGMYQDILSSFRYRPQVKINLVDNTQALAPIFTGVLNFIPSTHLNFYYVFVNHLSVGSKWCWNKLIYGNDIAQLSQNLEPFLLQTTSVELSEKLAEIVQSKKLIVMDLDVSLTVPRIRFPYYEGMNKVADKIWLGIYRRKNDFSINLLQSIAQLCSDTRIAQVQLLPWKSIMIKGIAESERIEWEKLLSTHGVNSRHSSLELNWNIADHDAQGTRIKRLLVKDFDSKDIRTYGLSFSIQTNKPLETSSSVLVVKRKSIFNFWGIFKFLTIYDILYAPDFSLHATEFQYFAKDIAWNGLSYYLQNLSDVYYKQLNQLQFQKPAITPEITTENRPAYQCQHCYTIYDIKLGDPSQNVIPMTSFEELPENYVCPLCENPKSDFLPIEMPDYAAIIKM